MRDQWLMCRVTANRLRNPWVTKTSVKVNTTETDTEVSL